MDEEYQQLLVNHLGEQGAKQFLLEDRKAETKGKSKYEILDIEKINSVVRSISQLSNEGSQVTNSKQLLQEHAQFEEGSGL